jgi:hypothetical protein
VGQPRGLERSKGPALLAGFIAVARSRLRIDPRKGLASKLAPKKYGDKVAAELSGPDGGPIREALIVEYVRPKG